MQICLLGGFEVTAADGRNLTPPGRKLRALLACLALPPGKPWPRERLIEFLWGDRLDEQGRGSLRNALMELRRILGEPSPILADRHTATLDPVLATVDAVQFEQLARAGKAEEAIASIGAICSTAWTFPMAALMTGC